MNMVYLVVQEGVYRHDIRGVYSSVELAEKAARRAAAEDSDSYHCYSVYASKLDEYAEDVAETAVVPQRKAEAEQ